MMKMKQISSAVGLSIVAAAPLYAACGAHIKRVSDGMDFMLVQTVQHVEGEKKFSLGIEGTILSIDITLDGGEPIEYGQYRAKDGTQVLLRCQDIG